MAAAMGFSSFGSQAAAKKRKFNAATDAYVEGDALEELDRGGKKGAGSGGNSIPLGRTRTIGPAKGERELLVGNQDEIALDDDDDGGDGERETVVLRTAPHVSLERDRKGSSRESAGSATPRYVDTSQAAPVTQESERAAFRVEALSEGAAVEGLVSDAEEQTAAAGDVPLLDAEKAEMQTRVDALLASMDSAAPPSYDIVEPSYASTGLVPPPHANLPNRPVFGARSDARSPRGGSSRGGDRPRGGRGAGRGNEKWYVDYYDPAFNANPWEALEKAKGLEPVGTWLAYPKAQIPRGSGQRA